VAKLTNTVVLCVSKDLPPALNRFCGAEGTDNVITLSAYRSDCDFGVKYGVSISDGAGSDEAFKDLFGRALIVVNPKGYVIYSELVSELANEPNYSACLKSIQAELSASIAQSVSSDSQFLAKAASSSVLIFSTTSKDSTDVIAVEPINKTPSNAPSPAK
jgi:hypothetical protein